MSTLTVSTNGQVTFGKNLLRHLGVRPGGKLAVEKLPDGRIEVRAVQPAGDISEVFDLFKRDGGPALSTGEINEAAAAGWAGKHTPSS